MEPLWTLPVTVALVAAYWVAPASARALRTLILGSLGLLLAVSVVSFTGTWLQGPLPAGIPEPLPSARVASTALTEVPARTTDTPGYDRDMFGGWADTDHDGCDTRQEILARDLTRVEYMPDGCTVATGWLTDPYTGEWARFTASDPMGVQIDHVVPLAEAWRGGASDWTDGERERFANDPGNLVAAIGEVNQSKSDRGPSAWQPTSPDRACVYATRSVLTLERYGLAITGMDRRALAGMLRGCR